MNGKTLAKRLKTVGIGEYEASQIIRLCDRVAECGEKWNNKGDVAERDYEYAQRMLAIYLNNWGLKFELFGLYPTIVKDGELVEL